MLKPVFDKLGLDAEGLQQRLHFLDWTAADGDRLRRVGPFGRRVSNDFVDALYQRLGQYPETRAILRGEDIGTLFVGDGASLFLEFSFCDSCFP